MTPALAPGPGLQPHAETLPLTAAELRAAFPDDAQGARLFVELHGPCAHRVLTPEARALVRIAEDGAFRT